MPFDCRLLNIFPLFGMSVEIDEGPVTRFIQLAQSPCGAALVPCNPSGSVTPTFTAESSQLVDGVLTLHQLLTPHFSHTDCQSSVCPSPRRGRMWSLGDINGAVLFPLYTNRPAMGQ